VSFNQNFNQNQNQKFPVNTKA